MNDIQKAIAKRLEKKIGASGYVLDAGQALGAMSEIWLYSCNVAGKKLSSALLFSSLSMHAEQSMSAVSIFTAN